MHQTRQIFFPRNIANEIGYQVKPQSPTPSSRPASHYTFSQPTSPKSPVNFVRYHQRQRQEYPPIEVEYGFPHTASGSRTRLDRNFRSLDFEVGLREDSVSNYSEAPPYHQYPEEDQWEDRGRGRRREREHPKADAWAVTEATSGDASRPSMAAFEARQRRAGGTNPPFQTATTLHPYVCALASTCTSVQTDLHNSRSQLSRLLSVSHSKSVQRTRQVLIDHFLDLVDVSKIPPDNYYPRFV